MAEMQDKVSHFVDKKDTRATHGPLERKKDDVDWVLLQVRYEI